MKSAVQCLFAVVLLVPRLFAADATNAVIAPTWKAVLQPDSSEPVGIERRVPWTTSRLVGSPEPPLPYVVTRVFPKLKFKDLVDMANTAGIDRLFVAEQWGKVFSFRNDPGAERPELVIDLQKEVPGLTQLYGMAFHPGFATNHFVYFCYVLKDGLPDGTHVSRFTMTQSEPPRIDSATEKIVITWLSGGHNGGCVKFGLDGFLYISTGDSASPDPPDPLNTGQDLSDLLSSVLRVDVDHEDNGKAYRVPADNPFVSAPGARNEIWAYGFRNPWRMSIDRQNGALWVGDVGWELWEMIYRVERGGNYGWSIVEGPQSVKPNAKPGPTPILAPVVSHPHSEAASITGGCVYHGKRLRQLEGTYIYGDWVTGKLWGLRHDGKRVSWQGELANSTLQVVCFGEDNAGELYIADYGGGIYQLEANPVPDTSRSFPRKLSETGLFASTKSHTPAPGVIPFSVNAELWSDGAMAERLAAFPGTSGVYKGKDLWGSVKWIFPSNGVLAKTLSLELEPGKARAARRIETQILHFDGVSWHGYSFRWNDDQSDAMLVEMAGADRALEIADAQSRDGHRRQTWHFHSRAECLRCHNPWGGPPLAFNFLELNKDQPYPSTRGGAVDACRDNQIRTLAHIGMLDPSLFDEPSPKLANPRDPKADLQERARSWLHVNCAHCHRFGAGGSVASFFNFDQKLEESRTLNASPSQGTFGIPGAHVITPGEPLRSVLYYRLSSLGPAHMPRIGSRVVSEDALNLIYDWIKQMPKGPTTNEADAATVANLVAATRSLSGELRAEENSSPKEPGERIERLLSSTVGALALLREMNTKALSPVLQAEAIARGTANANVLVRDLFERFVPEERRAQRLGTSIKPDQILALKGDAARGEKVFFSEGSVQCFQCHRVRDRGRDFGPDLSRIGQKYSRAQLLENILEPSKTIDPAFATYQLEAKNDQNYSGLLVRRSPEEVVLKDANLNETHVKLGDVKTMETSKVSAMPEGLLQALTAQEAADLIEFLSTLR